MDIKGDMLTESKSLRETVIDRVDVLDKVKKLEMMPDDINASVEMVADYYEVPLKTIQATIVKNKDELLSDGMKVIRGSELTLLKQVSPIPKNAPSFTMIPRRAILRIGMLLQDSEVAKAVRSYLLDKEEEKQIKSEESRLDLSNLSPTLQALIGIEQRQNAFEARQSHLEAQYAKSEARFSEIDEVKEAVTAIADNLTIVPDSAVVIRTVNELKRWTRLEHEAIFKQSYEILRQKHGFDVPRRVENERERIQALHIEQKGKKYAESTLKQKVNGIDILVREGYLVQFFEILNGWLTKEKNKSKLRLVQ